MSCGSASIELADVAELNLVLDATPNRSADTRHTCLWIEPLVASRGALPGVALQLTPLDVCSISVDPFDEFEPHEYLVRRPSFSAFVFARPSDYLSGPQPEPHGRPPPMG